MTDDRITAHADLVYSTCLRITGNPQDAADVSQEVFIAWMRNRGRIRGPLAAWLHGTARRRSLDWLRRQHRRTRHERGAPEPPPAVEPAESPAPALDAALAALDARRRTLVLEHHVLGRSQLELAERFRLSQATVSRLVASGIAALRQHLLRQGVTAAVLSALPAILASREPCPEGLRAPLLAQAQVQGADVLLQAGRLPGWWSGWPAWSAAIAATLALVGVGALLAWRLHAAAGVPEDLVAVVLARLPPAPPVAIAPTTGVPRYRSIEALIARLPPHDPALQERIRDWLRADDAAAPWSRLGLTPRLHDLDRADSKAGFLQPTGEELATGDRVVLAEAEPLLAVMAAPGAMLGEGAWLAEDYRDGRFHWWGDIYRTVDSTGLAAQRFLLHALARRALAAESPDADLRRIDALVAASRRGSCSLLSAMYAIALAAERDDVHVRLAVRGRLSETVLVDWCREAPTANAVVAQGLIGDPLLIALPQHEDAQRWGTDAIDPRWIPDPASTPSVADWIERPWRAQWTLESIVALDRISAALSGHDRLTDIIRDAESGSVMLHIGVPAMAESAQTAARARLAHAGKRLLVWMIHQTRQGQALPERLDEVVEAVAGGRDLLGGSDMSYGLTYQRLTPTRFRLAIDPCGASPLYADPTRLRGLAEKVRPQSNPSPPVLLDALAWEADVERLAEPAASTFGPAGDVEPAVVPAAN